VTNLLYDPDRQIAVTWSGKRPDTKFPAELRLVTEDRPALLADVTQVIADGKSNIKRIEARTIEDGTGEVVVVLEISGVKHLEKILKKLRAVPGVREVRRQASAAPVAAPSAS
jgi:GTP pyrophosphokinase